ncbi:MAG: tetratricopeptide repeat protein [Lachnospiraceae bacterium]|nr:tetratricopeptide repeat protein [Lachnospiraceae bacterium]
MKGEKTMKKCRQTALLLLTAAVVFTSSLFGGVPQKAMASQATSYTYTLDENGYFVRTQDAYLTDKTITDLGLSGPQDLFIDKDNMLFIADTGNKRIVKYSIRTGEVIGELQYEGFKTPRGIFVTEEGDIYVADSGAKTVFRFSKDFELKESFGKPNTPLFSDTNFEPNKIAVDKSGNMYIIGEGVYSGVIQLAHTGEFLGYFTVNKTTLTFSQALQQLLFTREQLANVTDVVPTTFSNVFLDDAGIVYTTTMGNWKNAVKKHNTSGGNMFKETVYSVGEAVADIYVDRQGIIYSCSATGYIDVHSKHGELIFSFGSSISNMDVAGLYSSLPAIAVDMDGNIWTIDGDKGYVSSFRPTDYAKTVYGSMDLYEQGRYEESLVQWNEVLKLNQMSVLAHNGVGKAYFHAGHYEEAMEHFEVAGNRTYYSEAFWEVRNVAIQKVLPYVFIAGVILLIIAKVVSFLDRKKQRIKGLKQHVSNRVAEIPVLKDFQYAAKICKSPMNRYYDIRRHRKGSVGGATAIYIVFFIVYMLYQTSKGFIYQYVAIEDMDIGGIVAGFFVLLGLFIFCNWLVTSIQDGDGTLAQVYMIPAYGSLPLLVSMIAITVCSYGMTYNESFLLTIILLVGIVWSVILIFLGFMTVHDYSAKENTMSILLTVVFMIIAAVMVLIIAIMWEELYEFLYTIGQEVLRNVLG